MPLYSVTVSRLVQQHVAATIEVEAATAKGAEALVLLRYEEEGFDLYPDGPLYEDEDDLIYATARLAEEP